MPPTDKTAEPHGAFTAALIETLQAMPADSPASLVYQRVKAVLEGGSVPDQEPDLDATAGGGKQPLFGGKAADQGRFARGFADRRQRQRLAGYRACFRSRRGQRVYRDEPGQQRADGEAPGAELEGIARSTASVFSPAGAKVAPGEVFELTKWVPAESAPLHVWLWPSNLSKQDVLAAATLIKAADVALVSDPAEEPWTHILCWDGTNWTLQQAGAATPVVLGPHLTAER